MSKKVRNIIIGLVILVVLGGLLTVLLLTQRSGDTGTTSSSVYEAEMIKLVEKEQDDITSIKIRNALDSYTISANGEGGFTVPELGDFPQEAESFDLTVARAAGMSASDEVETTLDNVAKYGLDDPQAEIDVTFSDGSTFGIYVGDVAPSDKGYYVQVKGKNSVYIASDNMTSYFLVSRYNYVDPNINQYDDTSSAPTVTEMTIERPDLDEPITITKGDPVPEDDPLASVKSEYHLTSPFHSDLDKEAGEAEINSFFTLRADAVVMTAPTDEQLAEYGFDEPSMVITVKASDGSTHTLTAGAPIYCNEDPDEVEEGHVHEIEYYYLTYDDKDIVYQITATTLTWMDLNLLDIVSQYVLTPVITDVASIDVTVDGESYTIELTSQTKEATESGAEDSEELTSAMVNGHAVEGLNNFKDFYQFLIRVSVESLVDEEPTESPRMTITYHYKASLNQEDDVLEFIPYGERKVAVALNGEASFVTRSAYVDRAAENLAKIAQDQEINPNW